MEKPNWVPYSNLRVEGSELFNSITQIFIDERVKSNQVCDLLHPDSNMHAVTHFIKKIRTSLASPEHITPVFLRLLKRFFDTLEVTSPPNIKPLASCTTSANAVVKRKKIRNRTKKPAKVKGTFDQRKAPLKEPEPFVSLSSISPIERIEPVVLKNRSLVGYFVREFNTPPDLGKYSAYFHPVGKCAWCDTMRRRAPRANDQNLILFSGILKNLHFGVHAWHNARYASGGISFEDFIQKYDLRQKYRPIPYSYEYIAMEQNRAFYARSVKNEWYLSDEDISKPHSAQRRPIKNVQAKRRKC